ncbi:MAG: GNAT family N-acetyltransferase [Rhodocyclales bacterium GT-UBC]|nr:MAG: GNAT family N-acetyltransferase [Rhodocyclales bacterium GT-UBC]
MKDFSISELAWADTLQVEAVQSLIYRAFDDPVRYAMARIGDELTPLAPPLERRFFVARLGDELVGAGGVKSADWASHTYLLYLSVVAPEARGQGIGRALVKARLAWLQQQQAHARVLVSTAKPKRFIGLGFRRLNRRDLDGKSLMFFEY